MNEYKDRGILKWAPFDALTGHDSMLEEMIYNINKKQKTSLSDDEYEELNITINNAINQSKEVSLVYYFDGYEYSTFGKIKKADCVKKTLVLMTGEEIEFDSILQIKLMR